MSEFITRRKQALRGAGLALAMTVSLGSCSTGLDHEAKTMDLNECGSAAHYGERQKDAPAVKNLDALVDRAGSQLRELGHFARKSGGEISTNTSKKPSGRISLRFNKDKATLITESEWNVGDGTDKLTFIVPREGEQPEISYGAVACTAEDGKIYPTKASEYIDFIYDQVQSPHSGN